MFFQSAIYTNYANEFNKYAGSNNSRHDTDFENAKQKAFTELDMFIDGNSELFIRLLDEALREGDVAKITLLIQSIWKSDYVLKYDMNNYMEEVAKRLLDIYVDANHKYEDWICGLIEQSIDGFNGKASISFLPTLKQIGKIAHEEHDNAIIQYCAVKGMYSLPYTVESLEFIRTLRDLPFMKDWKGNKVDLLVDVYHNQGIS